MVKINGTQWANTINYIVEIPKSGNAHYASEDEKENNGKSCQEYQDVGVIGMRREAVKQFLTQSHAATFELVRVVRG